MQTDYSETVPYCKPYHYLLKGNMRFIESVVPRAVLSGLLNYSILPKFLYLQNYGKIACCYHYC